MRWQGFDDAWHELYDPYSFQPHIDAFDLTRFAHGNHVHAHRFLGAHELTIDGVAASASPFGLRTPSA